MSPYGATFILTPTILFLTEGCSPPSWVQAAVKPDPAASRINCTVTASQKKKYINKKNKKIVTYRLIMFCIFLGRELGEKKGFKIFVTKTHGNILGAVWLDIHSILLDLFSPLFLLCTIVRLQEDNLPQKAWTCFFTAKLVWVLVKSFVVFALRQQLWFRLALRRHQSIYPLLQAKFQVVPVIYFSFCFLNS